MKQVSLQKQYSATKRLQQMAGLSQPKSTGTCFPKKNFFATETQKTRSITTFLHSHSQVYVPKNEIFVFFISPLLTKPDSSENPFCLQYLSFTFMLRYEASASYETDAGAEHNSTSKRLKRMAGLSQPIKTGPCFSDKNALFFCHVNFEYIPHCHPDFTRRTA
jgi:hypothetical protein